MTPELYMMIGMLIAFTSVALSIAGLYVIQRHVVPNPTFDVPEEDRDEPDLNNADLYMLIHEIHERLKALELKTEERKTVQKPARKTTRKTNGQFAEKTH